MPRFLLGWLSAEPSESAPLPLPLSPLDRLLSCDRPRCSIINYEVPRANEIEAKAVRRARGIRPPARGRCRFRWASGKRYALTSMSAPTRDDSHHYKSADFDDFTLTPRPDTSPLRVSRCTPSRTIRGVRQGQLGLLLHTVERTRATHNRLRYDFKSSGSVGSGRDAMWTEMCVCVRMYLA